MLAPTHTHTHTRVLSKRRLDLGGFARSEHNNHNTLVRLRWRVFSWLGGSMALGGLAGCLRYWVSIYLPFYSSTFPSLHPSLHPLHHPPNPPPKQTKPSFLPSFLPSSLPSFLPPAQASTPNAPHHLTTPPLSQLKKSTTQYHTIQYNK